MIKLTQAKNQTPSHARAQTFVLERKTRTFEDKIQTRILLTRPSLKYSRLCVRPRWVQISHSTTLRTDNLDQIEERISNGRTKHLFVIQGLLRKS